MATTGLKQMGDVELVEAVVEVAQGGRSLVSLVAAARLRAATAELKRRLKEGGQAKALVKELEAKP